jgi:hypothetical protein
MTYSVFYSWQSDSPSKGNRAFIREAIDAAVSELAQEIGVEDSPRIESGMEGVAGTPEVATVMFEKIKKSAVFIGDVTFTGIIQRLSDNQERRTPNPNVLLEMGFAAGVLGWGRVICIMNEHFGSREEQPFDVRNRRYPINYSLNPESMAGAARSRAQLTKWVAYSIKTVIANEHALALDAISSLDVNCLNLLFSLGQGDAFQAPNPNATTIGGALDTAKFSSAVTRLLDLRILKADVDPRQRLYAYHWTYLGKQVLTELGIRKPPVKPPEPGGAES